MRFAPRLKLIKHGRLIKYLDGKRINPIGVEISPSGKCQANCSWCFFKNEKNINMIKKDVLMTVLSERLPMMNVKSVTWTGGGEPTVHPDFNEFIWTVYCVNIQQGLFTNGVNVNYNPDLFEWIRVSKTNLPWDKENLKKLRECKSLGLCINYTGDDEEIKRTLDIGQDVGVDYVQVRPALKSKGVKVNYKVPSIDHPLLRYTEYKFSDSNKGKQYKICEGYHFVPYINEEGKVLVCPYRGEDNTYVLGDLNHEDFSVILGEAPRFVFVSNRCQICCKLHEVNQLIYNLRRLEDVNFV